MKENDNNKIGVAPFLEMNRLTCKERLHDPADHT